MYIVRWPFGKKKVEKSATFFLSSKRKWRQNNNINTEEKKEKAKENNNIHLLLLLLLMPLSLAICYTNSLGKVFFSLSFLSLLLVVIIITYIRIYAILFSCCFPLSIFSSDELGQQQQVRPQSSSRLCTSSRHPPKYVVIISGVISKRSPRCPIGRWAAAAAAPTAAAGSFFSAFQQNRQSEREKKLWRLAEPLCREAILIQSLKMYFTASLSFILFQKTLTREQREREKDFWIIY